MPWLVGSENSRTTDADAPGASPPAVPGTVRYTLLAGGLFVTPVAFTSVAFGLRLSRITKTGPANGVVPVLVSVHCWPHCPVRLSRIYPVRVTASGPLSASGAKRSA